MKSEEHQIQTGIVRYLALMNVCCFAVPNGGRRDAITGARLKAEGVKAGVSDLIVLLPGGRAVFAEIKTPKGHLQDTQKKFQATVESKGFEFVVWRSVDDAAAFVKKERIAA